MLTQTIASFVFGLIPGSALGIILLCAHTRRRGGIERDMTAVRLAQLPFAFGPFLLIGVTIYEIYTGDFHPPWIGLIAGLTIGIFVTYGFLYLYAVRRVASR
jgi:hypothetical protein